MVFQSITDYLVVVAGAIGAIYTIIGFIRKILGKPFFFFKARQERRKLEERVEIVQMVQAAFEPQFEEIKKSNELISMIVLDMLRERINDIYESYRHIKSLPEHTHDALVVYYRDYKALHGNTYIDKIWSKMEKWEIIPDNEE